MESTDKDKETVTGQNNELTKLATLTVDPHVSTLEDFLVMYLRCNYLFLLHLVIKNKYLESSRHSNYSKNNSIISTLSQYQMTQNRPKFASDLCHKLICTC